MSNVRFKQPGHVVRLGLAFLWAYFVLAGPGLVFAQAGFDERDPESWLATANGRQASGTDKGTAMDGACALGALYVQDSFAYTVIASSKTCKVSVRSAGTLVNYMYFDIGLTPICPANYVWSTNDGDNNADTGKCKRPQCVPATQTCWLMTGTPIATVPASVCVNSCVVAQSKGSEEIRYERGQQKFFYEIIKATTSSRCYVAGAGSLVACNTGAPGPQDPCQLPDASTNPACGGGNGCPAGTVAGPNGSCVPGDPGNGECPTGTYRVGGQGACVPYPGSGTGGDGGTGGGASGSSGVSGGDGGAGGAGASGSGSNGGAGGGGGAGGAGGQGGGGGAGGAGGAGGVGGAAGESAKCGSGFMVCEDTFKEYWDYLKDYFKGSAAEETAGKEEITKARAGGYADNPMNKGPLVDVSGLSLDMSGGGVGGSNGCPADRSISLPGGGVTLSFGPLCDFAALIRAVLITCCGLLCARIVFGSFN